VIALRTGMLGHIKKGLGALRSNPRDLSLLFSKGFLRRVTEGVAAFSHLLSLEFIKHLKNYTDEELIDQFHFNYQVSLRCGTALLRRTPTGTPYPSFNIEYPLKDGGPWT